jgi:TBC1 domain family protein 5
MSTFEEDKKCKRYSRFNAIYEDPYDLFISYLRGNLTLSDIGQKCKTGKLNAEFRSTLYKIFLNILPYDNPSSWKKIIQEQRELYHEKLNALLSQNENIIKFINCHAVKGTKPYEEIFCLIPESEKELLSLIKLDIDRTFQELDLFHNEKIKELLTKILYVNSKDNPDPSYCQGMNEILGTLFFAFLPSIRYNKYNIYENNTENIDRETNLKKLYYDIVDEDYLEADLFTVYSALMSRDLTLLYTYNDDKYRNKNSSAKYDLQNLTMEDLIKSEESDLLKRIKKIFYIYLKTDKQYFDFLFGNIEPNLFLLRWLLCMLDREISLKNVMWVWDCILFYEFVEFTIEKKSINTEEEEREKGHTTRLNFLDYVCLSMIIDLKQDTIKSDSSIILSKFLKFPNEKNIKHIMKEAYKLANELNGGNDKMENEILKKSKNLIE